MVLLPTASGTIDSVNLASSRTFIVPGAGTQTYYFKLGDLGRGTYSKCGFHNIAFAVLFIPASQSPIRFQAPCPPANPDNPEECDAVSGGGSGQTTVLRSFAFTAPRAGRALVGFHGSMFCENLVSAGRIVDLVTQIGTDPDAPPSVNDPGALRHAVTLAGVAESTATTEPFNLASTRAFIIPSAGTRTFHFKMRPLLFQPQTSCYLYNLAFTVVFV
jgi:hypothetical protein